MSWLTRIPKGRRRAVWALLAIVVGVAIFIRRSRARLPPDTTVEGAYARIVLSISEAHPRDIFAYLETEAQWACFTIRKYRSEAYSLVETSYPEPERSRLLTEYGPAAHASDGPDVFIALAADRGFVTRLRRDLSGIRSVAHDGDRATIETARGARYTFRKRENGIWGLTLFTAELVAEAQKAARDLEVVRRAAADYATARAAPANGEATPVKAPSSL